MHVGAGHMGHDFRHASGEVPASAPGIQHGLIGSDVGENPADGGLVAVRGTDQRGGQFYFLIHAGEIFRRHAHRVGFEAGVFAVLPSKVYTQRQAHEPAAVAHHRREKILQDPADGVVEFAIHLSICIGCTGSELFRVEPP